VNDLACQRLGYSRNELIKMSPQDIDKPENINRIALVMENLIKKRKTSFETEHITKNGELIPVEINTHLFTIRGKEYILSIVRDIKGP
jgi:PAS domain S-box-containing protein